MSKRKRRNRAAPPAVPTLPSTPPESTPSTPAHITHPSWWKRLTRLINWPQAIVSALLGLAVGGTATTAINVRIRHGEKERETRLAASRVARFCLAELQVAELTLQVKNQWATAVSQHLAQSSSSVRYETAMLRETHFSAMGLELWGEDFKSLLSLGPDGEAAYDRLRKAYAKIGTNANSEATIFHLLDTEPQASVQKQLLTELIHSYEAVRPPVREAREALWRLPTDVRGPGLWSRLPRVR